MLKPNEDFLVLKFCRGCYNIWRWIPGIIVSWDPEPPWECPNCGGTEYTTVSDKKIPLKGKI